MCSVTQLCPTLCNPMDYRLPDFSDHGNFQARILEWVATSYIRVSSQPWNRTCISCVSSIGRRTLHHCTIFIISFLKSVSIRRGLLPCLAFQGSSHGLLTGSGFSASLFYLYISYLPSLEETVIYWGLCSLRHHRVACPSLIYLVPGLFLVEMPIASLLSMCWSGCAW